MKFDADLYNSRYVPLESARCFLVQTIPEMGWTKSTDQEVLDAGCGTGGTTKNLILPIFQNPRKILAFDSDDGMIGLAKKANSSPHIEYFVANIENWDTVQHLENQITKLVSILCFNWLTDQRKAFQNVFHLLKPGGEAAIFFALQGGFFATILEMQKNPKWSQFFKGVDIHVPESHYMGYGAVYYEKMLKEVGFEVLYCKAEEKFDVFTSEDKYRKFYTSICPLREHVPKDHRKEFENEYIEELIKQNGRDSSGKPRHKGKMIEMIVKKNKQLSII